MCTLQIDYILFSKPLLSKLASSQIGYKLRTDHAWVDSSFNFTTNMTRHSFWSLNKFLLLWDSLYKEFESEFKNFYQDNANSEVLQVVVWDTLKTEHSGKFILTVLHLKNPQQTSKIRGFWHIYRNWNLNVRKHVIKGSTRNFRQTVKSWKL